MEDARKILKDHGLNITTARLVVLDIFLRSSNILDHSDLMYLCAKNVNRITLYRTLQIFYQHHLLLKVPSSNGLTKYLYRGIKKDRNDPRVSRIPERQIHLICQDCGKIISLENFRLPQIVLPKNFAPAFMDLIVNGKCKNCSKTGYAAIEIPH